MAYSRTPVTRQPRVMCQSKDHNAVLLGPVDDGERKSFDEHMTRTGRRWRTRLGKRERPRSRFFDRRSETLSQTRLGFTIISHLGKKLVACGGDEANPFHRAMRLASVNTSSAE